MFDIQYCKNKYKRVEECLEEEMYVLSRAIQGELGDSYKKVLIREKDEIKKNIKNCNL